VSAGAGSPLAAAGAPPRALEIQIHPANRCRPVRTLMLGRPLRALLELLALAYLLFLAAALALAPGVARGLAGSQDYSAMAAERMRQGARLQGQVRELESLARRGETVALDLRKVELAYGLAAPPAGPPRRPPLPAVGGRAGAGGDGESIYADAVLQGERLRVRQLERLSEVDRMLADLQSFERAYPERVRETPSASPLAGRDVVLVAPFARRRNPFTHELAFHTGLDLAAPAGSPVRAPADARVAYAGRFSPSRSSGGWWRLGNLVILVHGDRFATVFGHCAELRVRSGQAVHQGEVVATVGATGWATSPQLHYEVWRRRGAGDVVPVDPRLYILDRRWPNEEQLLAGLPGPRPGDYDPLPVSLGRR